MPPPDDIRAAVERISASPQFRNSDRMTRFLRFVVERSLAGEADSLKEYVLGVEVFDRAQDYDPKTDTIVRVEARRVRRKLDEYYAANPGDSTRISIPSPGYAPSFDTLAVEPQAQSPAIKPTPLSSSRRWLWLAASVMVIAGSITAWYQLHSIPPPESIAVLPVLDASEHQTLERFGEGMMDQILDSLTSVPNLKVVSRTSSMQFKGKSADIREIGRQLGAASVLESSLRESNGRLRITLQLIRAQDGYHYWSYSFDRTLGDPFELQDEIARYVTSRVAPKRIQAQRHRPKNPEAYELYVQARQEWGQMPQGLPAAEKTYLKALALDPDFALAWSGLAETYSYMIEWGLGPGAELANKSRTAADRALALDPDLAEAHTARGTIAMTADWDWQRAGQELKRAIELKPSYSYAVHWYAHWLEYSGHVKEGLAKMQEAQELDPLLVMFQWDLGSSYIWNHQYQKALDSFERTSRDHPHNPGSAYGVAITNSYMGRKEQALAAARDLANYPEGGITYSFAPRAMIEAKFGDPAKGKRLMDELEAAVKKDHVGADLVASYYLDRGETDKAYPWFDRAIADHSDSLLYLKIDPRYDPYRSDPRFQAVLKRIGL